MVKEGKEFARGRISRAIFRTKVCSKLNGKVASIEEVMRKLLLWNLAFIAMSLMSPLFGDTVYIFFAK